MTALSELAVLYADEPRKRKREDPNFEVCAAVLVAAARVEIRRLAEAALAFALVCKGDNGRRRQLPDADPAAAAVGAANDIADATGDRDDGNVVAETETVPPPPPPPPVWPPRADGPRTNATERALATAVCACMGIDASAASSEGILMQRFSVDSQHAIDVNVRLGSRFRAACLLPDLWLRGGLHGVRRHVFVEFDSSLWHSSEDSMRRDRAKTLLLEGRDGEHCVVRVRQWPLPLVHPEREGLDVQTFRGWKATDERHVQWLVRQLLCIVVRRVGTSEDDRGRRLQAFVDENPPFAWPDQPAPPPRRRRPVFTVHTVHTSCWDWPFPMEEVSDPMQTGAAKVAEPCEFAPPSPQNEALEAYVAAAAGLRGEKRAGKEFLLDAADTSYVATAVAADVEPFAAAPTAAALLATPSFDFLRNATERANRWNGAVGYRGPPLRPRHVMEAWLEQNGLCAVSGRPMGCAALCADWAMSVDRRDESGLLLRGNVALVCLEFNGVVNPGWNRAFFELVPRLRAAPSVCPNARDPSPSGADDRVQEEAEPPEEAEPREIWFGHGKRGMYARRSREALAAAMPPSVYAECVALFNATRDPRRRRLAVGDFVDMYERQGGRCRNSGIAFEHGWTADERLSARDPLRMELSILDERLPCTASNCCLVLRAFRSAATEFCVWSEAKVLDVWGSCEPDA